MYCVFENGNIIAIHNKKEVIKEYCDRLSESHPEKELLYYAKIKRKSKIEKSKKYEELYLVPYMDTFVQSGYVKYLDIAEPDVSYRDTQKVLINIIETNHLGRKERKAYENVILSLEKLRKRDMKYTPSIEELERMKDQYLPYINGYYL